MGRGKEPGEANVMPANSPSPQIADNHRGARHCAEELNLRKIWFLRQKVLHVYFDPLRACALQACMKKPPASWLA